MYFKNAINKEVGELSRLYECLFNRTVLSITSRSSYSGQDCRCFGMENIRLEKSIICLIFTTILHFLLICILLGGIYSLLVQTHFN